MRKKHTITIIFSLAVLLGIILAISFVPTNKEEAQNPDKEALEQKDDTKKDEKNDKDEAQEDTEVKEDSQTNGQEALQDNYIDSPLVTEEREKSIENLVSALESRINEIDEKIDEGGIDEEEKTILERERGFNEEKLSGYKNELDLMSTGG